MDDLKRMSDSELAQRMFNYITDFEKLQDMLLKYLDGNQKFSAEIKELYARLKQQFQEEYHYLSMVSNEDMIGISRVHTCYAACIRNVFAQDLKVKANAPAGEKMFNAIYAALIDLNYHLDKEKCKKYIQ